MQNIHKQFENKAKFENSKNISEEMIFHFTANSSNTKQKHMVFQLVSWRVVERAPPQ